MNDDDDTTNIDALAAHLQRSKLEQMRNDERLKRVQQWIDGWQTVRSFGLSLQVVGEWVIRLCISLWLFTEAWHRWFAK